MQVDNSGVGHLITYNKQTGATSVQSVGQVGKTSSTVDPSVASNYMALILQGATATDGTKTEGLIASKGKADGMYDPSVYLQWRQHFMQADPAFVPQMDKQFLATDGKGDSQFFSPDGVAFLEAHGVYLNSNPTTSPTGATASNSGFDSTGMANNDSTPTTPDVVDNSISTGQ
jgi:hypothetical protein